MCAGARAGLCAGLDAAVQGYPFEAWGLGGPQLLALSPGALEALGVRQLGHQELLLEAVEQLRDLVRDGTRGCGGALAWVDGGTWGAPRGRGGGYGGTLGGVKVGTRWHPGAGGWGDMGSHWAGWCGGHGGIFGWRGDVGAP